MPTFALEEWVFSLKFLRGSIFSSITHRANAISEIGFLGVYYLNWRFQMKLIVSLVVALFMLIGCAKPTPEQLKSARTVKEYTQMQYMAPFDLRRVQNKDLYFYMFKNVKVGHNQSDATLVNQRIHQIAGQFKNYCDLREGKFTFNDTSLGLVQSYARALGSNDLPSALISSRRYSVDNVRGSFYCEVNGNRIYEGEKYKVESSKPISTSVKSDYNVYFIIRVPEYFHF